MQNLLSWIAKTWPSHLPAHASAQDFHTNAPAREVRMGGARSAEKKIVLLARRIAGISRAWYGLSVGLRAMYKTGVPFPRPAKPREALWSTYSPACVASNWSPN